MSETQLINQLKFRVQSLESTLSDRQKQLQQYKNVEQQADSKINSMNKLHSEKVKSLLNSIQILKKQKAAVENLSKEHKRSKLIQQLNKEILDQDLVIEILRKFVYDEKGKDKGRDICDDIIVKALTKGPERIRPLTREQLRMEIQKLKTINLSLEGKLKVGGKIGKSGQQNDDMSDISSVSERSFVNQNEQIYKKLKDLQGQNESIKLQLTTKGKIIEKLKSDIKEKDKLRGQMQLLVNQLEIASRKIVSYQRLLRESKENMNNKIMELYQRELKVEELELNTIENGERLKQAHQSTNILLNQIKQEREQLKMDIQLLKKENENLILENCTNKKKYDDQKNKIEEVRGINSKNKEELGGKLKLYEDEIAKIVAENKKLQEILRNNERQYFQQREKWVVEKQEMMKQIQDLEMRHDQIKLNNKYMEEVEQLKKENRDLKEIVESGGGSTNSDNKILLDRLENYRIRLQFYDNKTGGSRERQLYDQLFKKYDDLLKEFEQYKKNGPTKGKSNKRKNIIEITRKQQKDLDGISSGLSKLHLDEIDSDILDNFDSDYEYSLRLNEIDHKKFKNIPKISQEDQQLLKLINSDLWDFVKDDRVQQKLDQIINLDQSNEEDQKLMERIRKIKNISHPMGKKLTFFDSELKDLEDISDRVSNTSALKKQIDKYDSDVDIEIKRGVKGAPRVDLKAFGTISDSYSSNDLNVSSAKSGESSFVKRKKGEKATVLKLNSKDSLSASSNGSNLMNSDVSSLNINESLLNEMDSQISVDFRKRKAVKK